MSVIMPSSGNTDCHTSDIGHWFAMTKTDFVYSLSSREGKSPPGCFCVFAYCFASIAALMSAVSGMARIMPMLLDRPLMSSMAI